MTSAEDILRLRKDLEQAKLNRAKVQGALKQVRQSISALAKGVKTMAAAEKAAEEAKKQAEKIAKMMAEKVAAAEEEFGL